MMKEKIVTKKRHSDWMAYVKDDETRWESGNSEAEAIGKLYLTLNPPQLSEDDEVKGLESLKQSEDGQYLTINDTTYLDIGDNVERLRWLDWEDVDNGIASDNHMVILLFDDREKRPKTLGFILFKDDYLKLLEQMAEERLKALDNLTIEQALYVPQGHKAYSPLRRLYDSPNFGGYLYPGSNGKFKEERLALYRKYSHTADQRFRSLCEKAMFPGENVPTLKKLDMLFSKAWSDGHSAGYNEVWNYYRDYAELILD